ncbi:MAG: hypothetical protein GX945_06170 [Lentisphaerae bacterium]|jgi:hypothetical protein|nr:hypothetical protein [Lentisphaerota bacterium]
MKMTSYVLLIGLCVLFGLPVTASTPAEALKAALVPNASVVFFSDLEKAAKSPLAGQFEQFRDQVNVVQQGGMPDQLGKWNDLAAFAESMAKDLGVKREDILRNFVSINLAQWMFGQQMNMQQMDMVFASEFRQPIEKKKLRTALEENSVLGGVESIIDEIEIQGVPVVSVFNPDAPADALFTQLFVAMLCEGRVLFFGGEVAVKSALERLAAGKAAEYAEGLAEMQQGCKDCDSFFLFAPTEPMRGKIAEFAQQQQAANPAMGNIMAGFAKMKGTVFTVKSGDKIDFAFSVLMATAEDATLVKSMLMDSMVLPSLKMMLMQKIGKMTPLLESMKTEQKDNAASFKASVTQEDISIFAEVFKPAPENDAAVPVGIPAQ